MFYFPQEVESPLDGVSCIRESNLEYILSLFEGNTGWVTLYPRIRNTVDYHGSDYVFEFVLYKWVKTFTRTPKEGSRHLYTVRSIFGTIFDISTL